MEQFQKINEKKKIHFQSQTSRLPKSTRKLQFLVFFSSLPTQLSQLIRSLPPLFLGTYILATSLLACSSLFIVMIFLDFLSILKFPLIPFYCSCSIPHEQHSPSVCYFDLILTIELRFHVKFEPP